MPQNKKVDKKKTKNGNRRPPPKRPELEQRIKVASTGGIRGKDPIAGYRAMANMVVDPHGSMPVLLPDKAKTGRAVRKFTKTLTVKASDDGCANGATLIVAPELYMPVYYTGGATPIPPAAPGVVNGIGVAHCDKLGNVGDCTATFTDTNGNKGFLTAQPKTHTQTYKAFNISKPAGESLHCSVSVASDTTTEGLAISFVYAAAGAAAWTVGGQHTMKKGTNEQWEFNFTAACDHVGIIVPVTNSQAHVLKIGFDCAVAQVFATSAVDLSRSLVIQNLEEASGGRVTAISLLCTNVSPALSRGGQIVMARLPSAIRLPDPASLQSDYGTNLVYVGDAANGGYTWWMPSEILQQGYLDKVQLQHELLNTNILYANISGWAPDSVFQVKVTFVVEFLINSPLYEKIEPPLATAKWDRLYQLLGALPASSCNPEHTSFKDYIKWGTDKASGAVKYVAKHSAELLALAELIAALA